jgi:signal peptidase I
MKRTLARVGVGILLAVSLTLTVLLLVLPRVAGYRTYVVTGRSMTGIIFIGSLVYSDPVPVQTLRVGDIITFVPPNIDENVTHRIVGLRTASDGTLRISTKGDAVPNKDPWQITPTTAELPREVMAIPYLGYVIALLSLRLVRVMLFTLPAMLAALVVLARLWRESGEAPAAETSAAGASSPPAAQADAPSGLAEPVTVSVRVWEAMP